MLKKLSLGLFTSLLVTTSVAFQPRPAFSLSCLFTPLLSNIDASYPLIIGEVQSVESDGSIKVQVQETFIGAVNKTLLHIDSRSFVYWSGSSALPKGSKWVFKLAPKIEQSEPYDFHISPCLNPPKVQGNNILGYLSEQEAETLSIQEFRSRVQNSVN